MPLRYRIISEKRLVYAFGEGDVTTADLLAHIDELAADPQYQPPMKVLVDCSAATVTAMTVKEADDLVSRKTRYRDRFKSECCAIVVNNPVDFGMVRIHSAKVEPAEITTRAFRNTADAKDWLHVDVDEKQLTAELSSRD